MPFQIFRPVLPLAIFCLVKVLHNSGACQFRAVEVGVNVIDKNRERLRAVTGARGAREAWSSATEHDPSHAQTHLRALDRPARLPITVVLDEAKSLGQPGQGLRHIFVCKMRQHSIYGDGAIVHHPFTIQLLGAGSSICYK